MTATDRPRQCGPAPGGTRAVVPAVGKALEAAVVVLFLAVLTATMFGGLVPEYRGLAGDELGDRTLSVTAHSVEDAIGPDVTAGKARLRTDIPETIAGEGYRIRTDGTHLVLDHPHPGVGGRTQLALPDHVVAVRGQWHSRLDTRIRVDPAGDGVVVRLVSGSSNGTGRLLTGGRR